MFWTVIYPEQRVSKTLAPKVDQGWGEKHYEAGAIMFRHPLLQQPRIVDTRTSADKKPQWLVLERSLKDQVQIDMSALILEPKGFY